MSSLNQCNFIGNIGKIETRYLSNGDAVTNCSLAVNESFKDKDGNKKEKCEWVNITAYRKLAEIMGKFCVKGMQIYISGKWSTRKWTDKEGIERYVTEIIATDMKMLGGKSAEDKPAKQSKEDDGFSDFDSDIPF